MKRKSILENFEEILGNFLSNFFNLNQIFLIFFRILFVFLSYFPITFQKFFRKFSQHFFKFLFPHPLICRARHKRSPKFSRTSLEFPSTFLSKFSQLFQTHSNFNNTRIPPRQVRIYRSRK